MVNWDGCALQKPRVESSQVDTANIGDVKVFLRKSNKYTRLKVPHTQIIYSHCGFADENGRGDYGRV